VQEHVGVLPDGNACLTDSAKESIGEHEVALRPIPDIEVDYRPLGERL
jgi:hypothetical protein